MTRIYLGDMQDEMDVRNRVCRDAINRVSTLRMPMQYDQINCAQLGCRDAINRVSTLRMPMQ